MPKINEVKKIIEKMEVLALTDDKRSWQEIYLEALQFVRDVRDGKIKVE